MSRPIMPPVMPHHRTEAEPSAKLGAPGEPAGDAEAIAHQQLATDEKTARRRAKLTLEVKEASAQSDLDPQDDLVDKATGKTVDNLVK